MPRQPAVYIMASGNHGTLYVGVTGDLIARVWQHRHGTHAGFTKEYGVTRLVYFETHATMPDAIRREKQIKKWNRAWKIRLVERDNRAWDDLWPELTGDEG